jgi:hypothetical protein
MSSRSSPARSNASMAARALSASPMVPTTRFVGYGFKSRRSVLTAFIAKTPFNGSYSQRRFKHLDVPAAQITVSELGRTESFCIAEGIFIRRRDCRCQGR